MNYIFINLFGYIVVGYTTLFSYMMFAVLHYYFGCKVCKEHLDGSKPYSLRMILQISAGTVVLGLSALLVYPYTLIRYGIIMLTAVGIFIFREKVLTVIQMIMTTKKE